MKSAKYAVVLVTVPSRRVGRQLSAAALKAKLIACANILPGLESHYRWRGKLERSTELLLLLKTTMARLQALEKLILAKHPYDTPEFIVLSVVYGNCRYLEWIDKSLAQKKS